MRSARTVLLATVSTAAVLLTGCSTTVAGTPAATGSAVGQSAGATSAAATGTQSATGDPQTWTNNVCGSLLPFVKSVATQPQIDQSNPTAALKGISDYLGRSIGAADESSKDLDAVGPSPVASGDEVVSKLKDTLTTVRTSFAKSKDLIDKVDPNNLQQIGTALPQALAPLQDLSTLKNPLEDLKIDPTLNAAANKAPNCQALNKYN